MLIPSEAGFGERDVDAQRRREDMSSLDRESQNCGARFVYGTSSVSVAETGASVPW